MPVVMTACPWPKFFRSASLRVSNAFGLSGLGLARHSRLQCGWGCQGESVRGDALPPTADGPAMGGFGW